jgi:predicted aldo/keto reductase-like oxidoreductase
LRLQTGVQLLRTSNDGEDIHRSWENTKETIKTSATDSLGLHKLKHHKQWFDEEFLGFLDQRKQAKNNAMVQDPSQSNVDNPNSVRR